MDEKEGDGIFFGLCLVVFLQLVTVGLVTNEFVLNLTAIPVKTYWILIPRTISSFYMHSTLTGELQNGLNTMKYVVNHPGHFKRRALDRDSIGSTDAEDGWYIRLTYAFLLGFIQFSLTLVLEVMTLIFLNSMDSYLFILICYAALAGVANFDNMYASALADDNPINAAVGKKLFVQFHRYMKFENQAEDGVKGST